jgi:hypothetical protein
MAHHQVALQLPGVGRGNADVLQRPDPSRQPVHDPVLAHQPIDQRTGSLEPAPGGGTQGGALAVASDRGHIGGAQCLAVERD